MKVRIEMVTGENCEVVFPYITKLLKELDDGEDPELDVAELAKTWRETPGAVAYLATTEKGEVAGAMTLGESFAVISVFRLSGQTSSPGLKKR